MINECCCIYKITNDINGKIYVGQTTNLYKRWRKHISCAKSKRLKYKSHLYYAMKRYGIEHFRIEIIEKCSYEDLEEKERYWIEKLNSLEPNGYNILKGGKHLYKSDNPFYGKHHSDKTKEEISKKNTGRCVNEDERKMRAKINSGKNNPFYGKHHSQETIDIIRSKNIKNGLYKRLSVRMKKDNPCKPEIHYKPVIMHNEDYSVIKFFKSLTDAGKYIKRKNLSKALKPDTQIGAVCNGRQNKAFGYFWEKVNIVKQYDCLGFFIPFS